TVRGRQLMFRMVRDRDDVPGCQLLFISSAGKENQEVIDRARRKNVLTIGESSDFLLAGGMIRLFLESEKVRFEINLPRVEGASLKLSAKLLNVAAKVYK